MAERQTVARACAASPPGTQQDIKAACARDRPLAHAHRLYRDAGPVRHHLEARLLAGEEDLAGLASATDVTPPVVATYRATFLDCTCMPRSSTACAGGGASFVS